MNVIEQIEHDELSPVAQTVIPEDEDSFLFHISRNGEDEELFIRALNGEIIDVFHFDRRDESVARLSELGEQRQDDIRERYRNSLSVVRDSSYEADTTGDWVRFGGWVVAAAGVFGAYMLARRLFFVDNDDE